MCLEKPWWLGAAATYSRDLKSNTALALKSAAGALFAAARVATLRAEVLDHLELAAPDGEQLGARGGGQGELLHSGCEKLLGGVGTLVDRGSLLRQGGWQAAVAYSGWADSST